MKDNNFGSLVGETVTDAKVERMLRFGEVAAMYTMMCKSIGSDTSKCEEKEVLV